jgi:hypothetical protein
LSGLSNHHVDKLKKTCLPKVVVSLDTYLDIVGGSVVDEKEIAKKIFDEVL